MEKIGLKLKHLRLRCRYSIKDVQNLLLENGIAISKKSIYKWEEDVTCPNLNTIKTLLKIYKTNITDFFNNTHSNKFSLTIEEMHFITMLRYDKKYLNALMILFSKDVEL